jgi:predicted amidohydrolase YtcJ
MVHADLLFRNGTVITLDPQNSVAEALTVKDGKVQATGSVEGLSHLMGPGTQVVDMGGGTATPGLISTHDHFLQHGVSAQHILDVRYPKARSCEDIAQMLADRAEETEEGKWIIATGWDETLLKERRFPNRWDIDQASPDNPVWLRRVFEMGVANSLALEAAGVTKDTPDPRLGSIDRSDEGEPTGLLRGMARDLVTQAIPPWTRDELEAGLRRSCDDFLAQGITTVVEPGILTPQLEAYRSLHAKGGLTVRVYALYGFLRSLAEVERAVEEVEMCGDDVFRLIGLKMQEDGGIGPRTALLYEPYVGQPENRGMQLIPAEELKEMALTGHRAGFQVAIHAIGDRAIDIALDAFHHAQTTSPRPDPRHQIVHCYFPSPDALRRLKELDIMVNTQAPFIYWLGDSFLTSLGEDRCDACIPLNTMLQQGLTVANSHDTTVTPPQPRYGLYASVARRTIQGQTMGTQEAVTPLQALRTYTTLAARHIYMEDRIGSLEPGKYADIAVWDRDPLRAPAEDLKDLRVNRTYVQGTLRYPRTAP